MEYTIRIMVKEDIEQVNEIDREAFPTQWPPANYRQELQNKIAHYIVACDSSRKIKLPSTEPPISIFARIARLFKPKAPPHASAEPPDCLYIVGFAGIWMMADEAHVTNLAVRETYRGKGIGELLLLSTVDLADELKASFLTLEVRASNTIAQQLYTKYGFVQMGIRRGYYLDNHEDAIIMTTDTLKSPRYRENITQLREALKSKLENRA